MFFGTFPLLHLILGSGKLLHVAIGLPFLRPYWVGTFSPHDDRVGGVGEGGISFFDHKVQLLRGLRFCLFKPPTLDTRPVTSTANTIRQLSENVSIRAPRF